MPAAVSVRWRGGALAFAGAHGDVVRVAPSRPADGSGCWSPAELLAAAVATGVVLRVVDEASRADVPLIDGVVKASCPAVADGRVSRVRVDATFETLPGAEDSVRELASTAANAPVASALGVPVELRVRVHCAEVTSTRRATSARL